ncbi:MAG: hypothetical protein Q8Q01_03890 [archaeon]|nr:hypothetical protein [archaeon]
MKNSLFAMFVIGLLVLANVVGAVAAVDDGNVDLQNNVKIVTMKVDGEYVIFDGNTVEDVIAVNEGATLNVRVGLRSAVDVDDIEVDAKISGYEYSDEENLQDSLGPIELKKGITKYVDLEINLPRDLKENEYLLRLRLLNREGVAFTQNVRLLVDAPRHSVDLEDVSFSPSVRAGQSLFVNVLLENYGDRNEEDVKVTVSIPELGVSATEWVDQVDADDRERAPEMFVQIPASAVEGTYTVEVVAEYNNRHESVRRQFSVQVQPYELNDLVGNTDAAVLVVAPETQTVAAGTTATYGVALANEGRNSKAYTIEVVSGDWASASVTESLVLLDAGKSKVVYVNLAVAQNAPAGEHAATLVVKSGDVVIETHALKATVAPAQTAANGVSLRNGVEIALIVLVVVLVVVGLIVGFSKLRKEEDEDQTYY